MPEPKVNPFHLSTFALAHHRACCQGQKRASFGQCNVNTTMVASPRGPSRPRTAVIAGLRSEWRGNLWTMGFVRENRLQTAWPDHLTSASRIHRSLLQHARSHLAVMRSTLHWPRQNHSHQPNDQYRRGYPSCHCPRGRLLEGLVRIRYIQDQDAFSSRSATQTLMMDCRGTPRRLASLSNKWTIHKGKSTFTLFCSCPGLLAFDISRYLEISSPSSNFLSNSRAFIYLNLLFSGSSSRNNPYLFTPESNNS